MYKNKENNFTGLTEEEVRRSREEHGSNKLPDPELKKWWEFALDGMPNKVLTALSVRYPDRTFDCELLSRNGEVKYTLEDGKM